MKHVVFVIHQLNFGGAQRVLINIINSLDISRYRVTLIKFHGRNEME